MAKSVGVTLSEHVFTGFVVDHALVGDLRRFPEGEDDYGALVEMPTEELVRTICEQVAAVSQGSTKLDAVGVAVPGLVKKGVVEEAPNLPQLKGARLCDLMINGLKAQNNGTGSNLIYFVVETKAPSGYVVNPAYTPSNPTQVTITPGTIAQAQVLTVTDKQVLPFILPLTGSTGNALFIGGGIALIALAIGAAFVAYRRKAQVVQD